MWFRESHAFLYLAEHDPQIHTNQHEISDSSKIDPASVEVSTPESGIYDTTRLWSALTRQRFSLTCSEVLRRSFQVGPSDWLYRESNLQ